MIRWLQLTDGALRLIKKGVLTKRVVAGILLTQADLLPGGHMHGQVEMGIRLYTKAPTVKHREEKERQGR